eukprot:2990621-Rhodomonas_salina.1
MSYAESLATRVLRREAISVNSGGRGTILWRYRLDALQLGPVLLLPAKIPNKKPLFQYSLYQECSFLWFVLASGTRTSPRNYWLSTKPAVAGTSCPVPSAQSLCV